jgi:hypothetical protein
MTRRPPSIAGDVQLGIGMMNPWTDQERTAIHQAAHVVIGEQLRPNLIEKASILPDAQGLGHVLYDEAALAELTNFDLAVILAAGPIAEALLSPSDDIDGLEHLSWRVEAIINAVERIDQSRDAILLVAGRLFTQGEYRKQ